MHALFTYGAGTPRYLGMWLVLTPVLVIGLARLRVKPLAIGLVVLTTLPSLSRNPPPWFDLPLRLWLLGATFLVLAGWLVARLRTAPASGPSQRLDGGGRGATASVQTSGDGSGASERLDGGGRGATVSVQTPGGGGGRGRVTGRVTVNWRVVLVLIGVALALRVPLAWWDPGISDIPTSSEIASRQLLHGHNPYTLPNPDTQVGHYQYPAGSILAHVPFVAIVPHTLFGEEHLGVRLALWVEEALAVALLAWAGAAAGRPRGGMVAAFAYAVHPTLVREAGMTVANDLILALLVVGAAVALSRRRPLLAGVLTGLAVSVKPAAVVVLPVLLVAVGWQPVVVALGAAAAVQLPFCLWPTVGLHGVKWILEPVGRPDTLPILRANSEWWPLYAKLGNGKAVIKAVELVAIAASCLSGLWAGWVLRRRGDTLAACAAAVSLPLLVSFALASMQRTNYQDWYLTAFILCVGLTVRERVARPDETGRAVPEAVAV